MKKVNGSTLIEVLIFIMIFSVIASGILLSLQTTLRKQPSIENNEQALSLARARMELIVGQQKGGALTVTDLCTQTPPPAVCNPDGSPTSVYNSNNYLITTTYDDTDIVNGVQRGRIVTITVRDPVTNNIVAQLRAETVNY